MCDNLFDLQRSSELPQMRWHLCLNYRKWLKQRQSHFHRTVPHKSYHFLLFWCILCTATPDILTSSENINTACVSGLSYDYGSTKPWFDSNMIRFIRKMYKLKETFLHTKLHVDYEYFKEQRDIVQREIKRKKAN